MVFYTIVGVCAFLFKPEYVADFKILAEIMCSHADSHLIRAPDRKYWKNKTS